MKQRPLSEDKAEADQGLRELATALAKLNTASDVEAFLVDLCTPAELEAMADRWAVIPFLLAGMAYRDIHTRTGVSVTTVGRVARTLERGTGGYSIAVAKVAPRVAKQKAAS